MEIYSPRTGLVPRDARQVARASSRAEVSRQLRQHAIDAETAVLLDKLDAFGTGIAAGMTSALRVTKLAEQLELSAPAASSSINYLRDCHALAVGELLDNFRTTLRRI
jgi:hypothetical protein